jgi:hypothetical protein
LHCTGAAGVSDISVTWGLAGVVWRGHVAVWVPLPCALCGGSRLAAARESASLPRTASSCVAPATCMRAVLGLAFDCLSVMLVSLCVSHTRLVDVSNQVSNVV